MVLIYERKKRRVRNRISEDLSYKMNKKTMLCQLFKHLIKKRDGLETEYQKICHTKSIKKQCSANYLNTLFYGMANQGGGWSVPTPLTPVTVTL